MPAYDSNNIFAKIIRGELPCHKVYEDDRVAGFPRHHAARAWPCAGDPEEPCAQHAGRHLRTISPMS